MIKIEKELNPVQRKRTKIVATISDRNCEPAFITELADNGMNVARFNTAHQTPDITLTAVNKVREASNKIAIMVDTKGPEVRTTKAADDFAVKTGDVLKFKGNPDGFSENGVVCVNYPNFVEEMSVGKQILIDDGELILTVTDKDADALTVRVENDGAIKSRKSVNTPGVNLNVPALSEKDKLYIEFCADHDIDFVAHSFVRNKEDLLSIQKILDAKGSKCKIIAKIENMEGVDKIDEILDHCYAVMVARGDLAVEIPREKVPVIQKQLVQTCIERRKPVIVATQMLHSMMENPSPTRAEVSDIANAIFDGADAIMLSGETAYGKYPVEAIKVMDSVAHEVEKYTVEFVDTPAVVMNGEISAYLARAAVEAAIELDAGAILADTLTGNSIRNMAGFRGEEAIYALCYSERVMRELALSYGVYPYMLENDRTSTDEFLAGVMQHFVDKGHFKNEDNIVFLAGNYGKAIGASFMKVSTVENILKGEVVVSA